MKTATENPQWRTPYHSFAGLRQSGAVRAEGAEAAQEDEDQAGLRRAVRRGPHDVRAPASPRPIAAPRSCALVSQFSDMCGPLSGDL